MSSSKTHKLVLLLGYIIPVIFDRKFHDVEIRANNKEFLGRIQESKNRSYVGHSQFFLSLSHL